MIWLGGVIGALVAAGVGYALGSWLVFVVIVAPFAAVGALVGFLWQNAREQAFILAHPEAVDARAESLIQAGRKREASRYLSYAAVLTEMAAPTRELPREVLEARAKAWNERAEQLLAASIEVFMRHRREQRRHERERRRRERGERERER